MGVTSTDARGILPFHTEPAEQRGPSRPKFEIPLNPVGAYNRAARDKSITDGNPKLPGEMIVASAS